MGGSQSKSESEQQSGFSQDVWGTQGEALGGMYDQLGQLFAQGNTQQSLIPGAVEQQQGVFDSANPAWQRQLGGGAYEGMNLQNQYTQALGGGGNEQFMNEQIMGGAGNNYVDAMKGQMQADANKALDSGLARNDARAAAAGMSGSSRQGLTEARLYEDTNDALLANQTQLGVSAFDKDLDRKMSIARNADAFDMNKLQNISGMMGQQQNAMQGGLNFGQGMQQLGMGQFNPYNAPWQQAGQYANALGRPTVLGSGTASGSSKSQGSSGGMFGG